MFFSLKHHSLAAFPWVSLPKPQLAPFSAALQDAGMMVWCGILGGSARSCLTGMSSSQTGSWSTPAQPARSRWRHHVWTQRNQQFKDIDFKEELINQCGWHGKMGKQEGVWGIPATAPAAHETQIDFHCWSRVEGKLLGNVKRKGKGRFSTTRNGLNCYSPETQGPCSTPANPNYCRITD